MSMSTEGHNLKPATNLYLETTNRCNLRCRGCILYDGKREPERDITFQDFLMITHQLENLERATLHGVGEPLLNAELPAMIRHLNARNVYTLFNSNGILLDQKRRQDLLESGLDELRISLDAATAAGYKKIRNSDQFDRIVRNLRKFGQLQQARSLTRPKLSLWFLGTKENITELPQFVELAADLGICDIYLQRLVYYRDHEGYGVAREDRSLRDTDHESRKLVQQSQKLAKSHGLRFNASGLGQPLESIQGDMAETNPWSRCYRPHTLIYITAAGNVLPCCIAPFATLDYASLILGNVYESSLKDIWHGARYQKFRDQLQTADPPRCCRGCGVLWSL